MTKKRPEHQTDDQQLDSEVVDEVEEQKVAEHSEADFFQQEIQEWKSKYARALADYQNLIKQNSKERQEYIKYANSELLTQLFPLVDQLIMAATHLKDPGLDMIVNQFHQLFAGENIEFISPSPGTPFDHHLHECIDTVDTKDSAQSDTIAETLNVGYKWQDGQTLRPAKVKVYKAAEEPPVGQNGNSD